MKNEDKIHEFSIKFNSFQKEPMPESLATQRLGNKRYL
jgi:hypothetical protein